MANTTGKKFGGRQKGATNKITKELRERIKDFLEANFDTIQTDFQLLEPEKRAIVFEKYLSFVLPKLASSSVEMNISKLSDEELTELLSNLIKRNETD